MFAISSSSGEGILTQLCCSEFNCDVRWVPWSNQSKTFFHKKVEVSWQQAKKPLTFKFLLILLIFSSHKRLSTFYQTAISIISETWFRKRPHKTVISVIYSQKGNRKRNKKVISTTEMHSIKNTMWRLPSQPVMENRVQEDGWRRSVGRVNRQRTTDWLLTNSYSEKTDERMSTVQLQAENLCCSICYFKINSPTCFF